MYWQWQLHFNDYLNEMRSQTESQTSGNCLQEWYFSDISALQSCRYSTAISKGSYAYRNMLIHTLTSHKLLSRTSYRSAKQNPATCWTSLFKLVSSIYPIHTKLSPSSWRLMHRLTFRRTILIRFFVKGKMFLSLSRGNALKRGSLTFWRQIFFKF